MIFLKEKKIAMENKIKQFLPNFEPYKILKIGNNVLGVKYILNISGYIPLIIGKGKVPKIWIYFKYNEMFIPVVEENISKTNQVVQHHDKDLKEISFNMLNNKENKWITLINVSYFNDVPNIKKLDLRPLGVNVYLVNNCLCIGSMQLENNRIEGPDFAFTT